MQPEHASCVVVDGRGLLILGASGSGKSGLALALMACGARLVADDRVVLAVTDGTLVASCPPPLAGLIEARGVGLLRADAEVAATVHAVLDMDEVETHRLPPRRTITLMGVELPLLHRSESLHLAAMVLQYMRKGRSD